jgi:dCTP diphosphatase
VVVQWGNGGARGGVAGVGGRRPNNDFGALLQKDAVLEQNAFSSLSSRVSLMDIAQIQAKLEVFATERDWDQFHSIRNLVLALVGEAGELAELIQWVDDSKIDVFLNEGGRERLGEEISDALFYLVRLADKSGIDLDSAITLKFEKNAVNYPVDKAKGSSKKYSDLSWSK